MPAAIVLINAEVGKESEILRRVCNLPEVKKGYLVYGVYDVAVTVSAETMEGLEGVITEKVRKVPGIRSTLTLIVSRECK